MGKFLLYACGICFLIAFVVGAIQDLGWALLLWPLALVGTAVAILLPIGFVCWLIERPTRRKLEQRERIAKLEAAAGIAVSMDGECLSCRKPLVVGARFCTYCGAGVAAKLEAVLCPKCKTQLPEDGSFCPECGAAVSHGYASAKVSARPSSPVHPTASETSETRAAHFQVEQTDSTRQYRRARRPGTPASPRVRTPPAM